MNGIKPDPDVKMDPDAITPSGSGYMDDDFYEDLGELQLPPKGSEKDIWLTRIPKWLYDTVSKFDDLAEGNDDDQIEIGEVQCFPDPGRPGGVSKSQPMRIFLNDRWHNKAKLPRAFELNMTPGPNDMLANTYIFTEKDLPGYKPNGLGQNKLNSAQNLSVQDPKARVQKRSKYKKAIPKQTTLLGSATREYLANPIRTKEFVDFENKRIVAATQGANARTVIMDDMNELNTQQSLNRMFKSFTNREKPNKPQLNKATRLAKNELIDALHQCFDQYAYWSMKAFKEKLKQPEAYLKEVLPDIADLVRSGHFASCWKRQAMYDTAGSVHQGRAPGGVDDVDDMDDDMDFEDVGV